MSISMHSLSADRVASSSAVYWYLVAGAVLLVLAMGPVLRGDPDAIKGTSVGRPRADGHCEASTEVVTIFFCV